MASYTLLIRLAMVLAVVLAVLKFSPCDIGHFERPSASSTSSLPSSLPSSTSFTSSSKALEENSTLSTSNSVRAPPPTCSAPGTIPSVTLYEGENHGNHTANQEFYKAFRHLALHLSNRTSTETFKILQLQNAGFEYKRLNHSDSNDWHDWRIIVAAEPSSQIESAPDWNNWYYAPPSDFLQRCDVRLKGSAVFFRGHFFGSWQYGHMNDLLPALVWLADSRQEAKLVLELDEDSKITEFLQWFDPALHERTVFVSSGTRVCVDSVSVMVPKVEAGHPEGLRSWELFAYLRSHIFQVHKQNPINSIVYLIRDPSVTLHGRTLSLEHSQEVKNLAKAAMKRHNRVEELVEFTGTRDGKPLSFAEQYRIFNSAILAFGPHGTGFSNVLWMPCHSRPAAIEFICSQNSYLVEGCTHNIPTAQIRLATFWAMQGGATWLRYYHVWVSNATPTFSRFMLVDLEGFAKALDAALE